MVNAKTVFVITVRIVTLETNVNGTVYASTFFSQTRQLFADPNSIRELGKSHQSVKACRFGEVILRVRRDSILTSSAFDSWVSKSS